MEREKLYTYFAPRWSARPEFQLGERLPGSPGNHGYCDARQAPGSARIRLNSSCTLGGNEFSDLQSGRWAGQDLTLIFSRSATAVPGLRAASLALSARNCPDELDPSIQRLDSRGEEFLLRELLGELVVLPKT